MSIDNFDQDIQDAQTGANPDYSDHSETTEQTTQEAAPDVDYRTKFSESSKEALRLLEENREKDRLIAELQAQKDLQVTEDQTTENLFPGFEELDEEAQINLRNYTSTVTQMAKEEIYKDPAITFARRSYNEKVWDSALDKVLQAYPELAPNKDEFKSKYFKVNNVPENIETVLGDVAKIYLYDKAKELGAQEERIQHERVEAERNTGGDRSVKTSRPLEEWYRMAQDNPAKFALLSKEYHADLESGKLKE